MLFNFDLNDINEEFKFNEEFPICIIQAGHPCVQRIIEDSLFSTSKAKKLIWYHELNQEFIQTELQSFSLFDSWDVLKILEAHRLPKVAQEYFFSALHFLGDRKILLEWPSNRALIKSFDRPDIAFIKVKMPAFWELEKVFSFGAKTLKIHIDGPAKDYFINVVPEDASSYIDKLVFLKNFSSEGAVMSLQQLEALLPKEHWNTFELSLLFFQEKYEKFFQQLSEMSEKLEILPFAITMQTYLYRLYLHQKGKISLGNSSFYKRLLSFEKRWSSAKIARALDYFSNLELQAKLDAQKATRSLRHSFIKSMSTN